MKKHIHILIFGFLFIHIISCDDQLDIPEPGTLDGTIAIRDLDDLEGVLRTAYGELLSTAAYTKAFVYLPDLMADNIRLGDAGQANATEANWQYTPGDDIGVFSNTYELIYNVNILLENAARFEDEPQKNRIVGQALALRALAHFDALRYYGKSYSRDFDEAQSGIPLRISFGLNPLPRNTVKEVYDQIFEDLLTARTLLGDVDREIQDIGPYFIDQRAVNALLARVSLYAEQWQDAVDYASSVLTTSSLSTANEYPTMWTEDADGEVLFAVLFSTPNEGVIGENFGDANGAVNLTYTADLAELYDANTDIRFSSFIQLNTGTFTNDRYLVKKYPGRDSDIGFNNAKVLRVSEMYLIRAEAYTKLSNDTGAMADLNTLRANRIEGYVNENLSGQTLVDAIATERRKELVAEGHRWFDLRRRGLPVVRGTDCSGLTVNCTLQADDFRFVYPIPVEELTANPNIKQNDGY